MGDFLASLVLFSRESVVAIVVSIFGLLFSLLGFLRIRTIRNAIHRDREVMEALLEFPEIQFHLEKAFHYLALSREQEANEKGAREALRDGLHRAYYLLDSFHRQYLGRRAVGNLYLCTARRYQRRGAISDAIFWYERAIRTSEALGIELSAEETRQCLVGLQKCHFMRFDRDQAESIARRATELETRGCRTVDEIRRKGWLFCGVAALELLWRRLRNPGWTRPRSFPVIVNKG